MSTKLKPNGENTVMKILGYNVRCCDDPNGHSIKERGPRILDIIKDYDPDICGFQEVIPAWMVELAALDDRFDHLLQYRDPKNLEGTPIFWRKDRFELLDSQSFWLSETPAVPSTGWNAYLPRICCYVALKEKKSGKVIHYFNTHFDFNNWCQRESAQTIIRRAFALGEKANVVCTADFNFFPDSNGYHSMCSFFEDVRMKVAPDNKQQTINEYKEVIRPEFIIDYCFYHGKGLTPEKYEVITRRYDGKYPSDHYGMYYEFEVK